MALFSNLFPNRCVAKVIHFNRSYTQVPGAYASMNFTGEAMVLYGTVSPDHANIRLTIDGRDVSIPGGSGGVVSGLRPQVHPALTNRDGLMLIMFLSD